MTVLPAAGPLRLARRFRVALAALFGICCALALTAGPAHADNPPGPDDPFGWLDSLGQGATPLSVTARGWAADPNALTQSATIEELVDGKLIGLVPTSVARPAVSAAHKLGPTPGFNLQIPVPDAAPHTVCVSVRNVGAGLSHVLGCVMTPSGASSASGHDPVGKIDSATATGSTMTVSGWAYDPDFRVRRSVVVLYVDGASSATVVTALAPSAARAEGSTRRGGFSITVPVASGAHLGCVWVVNVGFGTNSSLGCSAVDTRGVAATGPVPAVPQANSTAVNEALKHIGGPYVWAAEGPTAFDCSGLVQWSYRKAGVTTPRVSSDQFRAAYAIPASRAVPGDLVFYHDSVGHVYHVGIYLSPGRTVAAIDTAEGINYQSIYAPSATYGSFTHR
jgi:cell wall-associated NlpC family hydrolase